VTSLNLFARSVGASVGVATMGAILARSLAGATLPGTLHGMSPGTLQFEAGTREQLAHALTRVFAAGAAMSALGLVPALFLPEVDFGRNVQIDTTDPAEGARPPTLADGEPGGSRG
jgi:hypothetical protein